MTSLDTERARETSTCQSKPGLLSVEGGGGVGEGGVRVSTRVWFRTDCAPPQPPSCVLLCTATEDGINQTMRMPELLFRRSTFSPLFPLFPFFFPGAEAQGDVTGMFKESIVWEVPCFRNRADNICKTKERQLFPQWERAVRALSVT